MKRVLYLMVLWVLGGVGPSNAQAQSSFLLSNYPYFGGPPEMAYAPVFDSRGARLEGGSYLAELWGGVTPDSLSPAVDAVVGGSRIIVPFGTGARAGYFFSGRDALILVPLVGGAAWLRVRAWDTRLGLTYEDVVAQGLGGYGESPLFYAYGSRASGLDAPAPLVGLESFRLLPVIPEPSTWALLALGGLAVAWRVRRRRGIRQQRRSVSRPLEWNAVRGDEDHGR